jgi:uncharacterized protein HemX
MNENTTVITDEKDKSANALTVASIALVISIISIGLSGWIVYEAKHAEEAQPKNMDEKIDTFFEKQNQELDKVFDDK